MLVTVATEAELTNRAEIYDPATNRWTPTAIQRDGGVVTTLLADGRVLLTGAECDRYGPQLYDPQTDVVSSAGVMAVPNGGGYTATLLGNGKVLFAGGYGGPRYINSQPQSITQLYDPITNTWKLVAPMLTQRWRPQSLLLADGRVLVAGGTSSVNAGSLPFLTSAEIYDPAANTWTAAVGDIPADGYGSTALSVLGNGFVLAAGGGEDGRPTSSAELFDPNRVWSKTGNMVYARSGANAVTLADGSVMVVGGLGTNGQPLRSAERYDLGTGQWAVMPGGLMTSTLDQSAIPLKDGRVFVTAWPDFVFGHWSPADVQIFDPKEAGASPSPSQGPPPLGAWSSMPDIAAPFANYSRAGGGFTSTATATALSDGRVLVMGTGMSTALFGPGTSTNGFLVAIYDPAAGRSQLLASPGTITSVGFTATLLRDGKVLVVGGGAELYDPATDRWSPAAPVLVKRFDHTATLLTDGRVLISGGLTGPQANGGYDDVVSADIYDPASNRWSQASDPPPTLVGSGATGSLLHDGRVLVVAGYNATAALYEPKSNRWSIAPRLTEPAQVAHSAIVLANGKVLILRGCAIRSSACDQFAAPQLFDPATEKWSPAAPMINGREAFSATLLANGHVLVAGGDGPASVVTSGELYDPTANRWAATADMTLARAGHTATLLRNGSVLVIGGFFLGNLRSAELYTPPGAQGSVPAPSTLHSQLAGLNAPLVGGAVLLAGVVVVFLLGRLITGRRRANLR